MDHSNIHPYAMEQSRTVQQHRIRNIHIHDNLGEKDDHLTIGDGKVDFGHVLGLLSDYRGRYIIEARSLESAIESQARLRRLLGQ